MCDFVNILVNITHLTEKPPVLQAKSMLLCINCSKRCIKPKIFVKLYEIVIIIANESLNYSFYMIFTQTLQRIFQK